MYENADVLVISKLEIKNFRGLENVSFSGLSRVNLISGRNGVGKTSVLEALYLFAAPNWPDPINAISGTRGMSLPSVDDLFLDLFLDFDVRKSFAINALDLQKGKSNELNGYIRPRARVSMPQGAVGAEPEFPLPDGVTRTASNQELVFHRINSDETETESSAWLTRYSFPGPQPFQFDDRIEGRSDPVEDPMPTYFLSHRVPLAQTWASLFGQMQRDGSDDEIIELLASIEPRIRSVLPIPGSKGVDIYAKIDGMRPALPIALVGEGLNRAFQLAVLTRFVRNGLLLIDEIENGIHFRSLGTMFSQLYELAERFNVQIFAVTHSNECVDAARTAIGATETRGLSYYRLGREKGKVRAHHFDIDKLNRAHDAHMEVR